MKKADIDWIDSIVQAGVDAALFRHGLDKLEHLSLKDCPQCKHPVLARYIDVPPYLARFYKIRQSHFQCLTCGAKFTCTEKQVCELIKEGE